MFFIYDHYYSNDNLYNYIDENDSSNNINKTPSIMECFICYETSLEDKEVPEKLTEQTIYFKECLCDGWIHNTCLKTWYDKSHKCPICRKYMSKITDSEQAIIEDVRIQDISFIVFLYNYREKTRQYYRAIKNFIYRAMRKTTNIILTIVIFFWILDKILTIVIGGMEIREKNYSDIHSLLDNSHRYNSQSYNLDNKYIYTYTIYYGKITENSYKNIYSVDPHYNKSVQCISNKSLLPYHFKIK